MEIIGLLALIFAIYLIFKNNESKIIHSGPIVTFSKNGYESHLDFLEMHGFVSAEELQDQKDFVKKIESGECRSFSYEDLLLENYKKKI